MADTRGRIVANRPVPSRLQRPGKTIAEAQLLMTIGMAKRRRTFAARAASLINLCPAVISELYFVQQRFAPGEDKAFRVVSVIKEPITIALVHHDAAVAGTFPIAIAS